jgi:hypothetical protein
LATVIARVRLLLATAALAAAIECAAAVKAVDDTGAKWCCRDRRNAS